MMDTPIWDFITEYMHRETLRLHMPGHKGQGEMERADITEIDGADSLYHASGIIAQSEQNASQLFGHPTFYSTQGSSQCIAAMLYMVALQAEQNKPPLILAGRNAHKTFIHAAALLDLPVAWLYPSGDSYLECGFSLALLEKELARLHPAAVYLTSPDYLGNMVDVQGAARLCHQYGALLLVDGAHGAYLKFLSPSAHPMDLGADLCCASAHKTLPTLTGGAYLHTTPSLAPLAKNALALFGSTSPSYLILSSLDRTNAYLADGYGEKLGAFSKETQQMKAELTAGGYTLVGQEPLKITIASKSYGYKGVEFAQVLRQKGIEAEFADPDYVVLMLSPQFTCKEMQRLLQVLLSIEKKTALTDPPPPVCRGQKMMSLRQAVLSPGEILPIEDCVGRVAAQTHVSCPPAVPIVISGERIEASMVQALQYYGITRISVVRQ